MSNVFTPPSADIEVEAKPADSKSVVAAGFWLRTAAFIIDSVIINAVFTVFFLIIGLIFFVVFEATGGGGEPSDAAIMAMIVGGVIFYALILLAPAVYQIIGWSKYGTTIGKKVLGLRVIDKNTGEKLSVGKAIGRTFAYIISALPLYLGFFWIGWDPDKEGFHDKICQTMVVMDK